MSKCSRLEMEIQLLRQELAIMRSDRDDLCRKHASHFKRCGGGECCKKSDMSVSNPDKAANQDLYIAYLEEQIQRTRLKYKKQMTDVKSSASLLESKLQSVRQEMSCISARAQEVDKLQNNVKVLKSKLQRRDDIIARYNKQHAAFLGLINNLEHEQNPEKQFKYLATSVSSESIGCDGDRKTSDTRSKCKLEQSINFSCLGTALKNKLIGK